MLDVLLLEQAGKHSFYFEEHWPGNSVIGRPRESGRLAGAKQALRKGFRAMEKRLPLDERLCVHLRLHDQVALHVPARTSTELAARLFLSFLQKCVKKHGRWLLVDGALAILGATLVWIPGPNVFFFYPALRALGHHYAQVGGSKHQKQQRLLVQHCALLDDLSDLPVPELLQRAEEIEKKYGFTQLRRFLEKEYGYKQ